MYIGIVINPKDLFYMFMEYYNINNCEKFESIFNIKMDTQDIIDHINKKTHEEKIKKNHILMDEIDIIDLFLNYGIKHDEQQLEILKNKSFDYIYDLLIESIPTPNYATEKDILYSTYFNAFCELIHDMKINNIYIYNINDAYNDMYIYGFKLCEYKINISILTKKIKKFSKILDNKGIKNYKIINI